MQSLGPKEDIIYVAVDDDESVCRLFGRLLRAAGFQPVSHAIVHSPGE